MICGGQGSGAEKREEEMRQGRDFQSENESEVAQSSLTLWDPWTVAHQAPPSMGFSRQEYWSGLPFPSPGDCNRRHTTSHVSQNLQSYTIQGVGKPGTSAVLKTRNKTFHTVHVPGNLEGCMPRAGQSSAKA